MISRVLYDKGYQQYVDAAKLIKKDYIDVQFLLLGAIDDEYPHYVPKHIVDEDVKNGHITYLGYVTNVYDIIKSVDCIVLPSYYNEGLSRVLMEGLAMSKPIITTNIPGCQETVEDGVNGLLCKPKDSISLAEACRKFLRMSEKERFNMGIAGRKKAERQFDVKNVIQVYNSLTEEFINKF